MDSVAASKRREHKRVNATISVKVRSPDGQWSSTEEIRNISLGGVFIEMEEPLAFGTDIELEFNLPINPRVIRCRGFVVWSTTTSPERAAGKKGIGVRLMDIGVREMRVLNQFIEEQLGPQLSSDAVRSRRWALDEKVQASIREVGKPFEEELRAAELALVPIQVGQVIQPTILPLVKGEPVSLDKLDEMVQQGSMEATKPDEIRRRISDFARRFEDLNLKVNEIQQQHSDALNTLYEEEARRILRFQVERITKEFGEAEVDTFLQRVVDDLITHRLHLLGTDSNFTSLYRINPLLSRPEGEDCPVIRETSPSLQNLLGNVDREFSSMGTYHSDHMMIHAGSLLRADGGYLVLEVRDVLAEPGSWKVLLRALKTGLLDIVPSELAYYLMGPLLTPEPVPLNVKVILIGDPGLYQMLDSYDPDFPHRPFGGLFHHHGEHERQQMHVAMAVDAQGFRVERSL